MSEDELIRKKTKKNINEDNSKVVNKKLRAFCTALHIISRLLQASDTKFNIWAGTFLKNLNAISRPILNQINNLFESY
ncbi:hypothetical protein BpHYR1_018192 [Brachionus plicatilis]|uniref:Uncharacterized protein n=1 Tax=Brachionus plicatilis TaxID=10195 RepID=A0A3M7P877_BRAPC|nr:hypothetical protein BpHYR1_018192 [Brachionus plicatilis]